MALKKASGGKSFFLKDAAEIDGQISSAVNKGIKKGIRPSVMNKSTAGQFKKYMSNAKTAVREIVNSKDKLVFIDESGNKITGNLPRNLDQFSQAIEQVKRNVFEQYDALTQQAGKQGVGIDLNKTANELQTVFESEPLKTFSPETIEYAIRRHEQLSKTNVLSAVDAQDSIQILNQSLQKFYKDPSPANKGQAVVDAMIANKLREQLNTTIEQTTGGPYKDLKRKYGALKDIESDVTKRSIVDSRLNTKGLLDFSDIITAHGAVKALVS
jgi:hypothetical protein